ncbi:uncharacterized protein LOC124252881 isoform X2 [Haliotis rubra]|uniref:uncharacterized protein LOC124252881 isoform X2 n=1 Tax=Haliotis rubra TaxID=36100 RepID=UPI001EE51E4D|nr:uncharacterized protein LOC124252881 isoform X2 [Haliotis rubra]
MLKYNSETHPNWSIWRDDINDPGRGTLVKEDVLSLTPAITYQFHLYGVNVYGDGEGVTIITTTSSSGKFRLAVGLGTAAGAIVVSILAIGCILLKRTSGKREITNAPAELERVYEPVEAGDAEEDQYCNTAGLNNESIYMNTL